MYSLYRKRAYNKIIIIITIVIIIIIEKIITIIIDKVIRIMITKRKKALLLIIDR